MIRNCFGAALIALLLSGTGACSSARSTAPASGQLGTGAMQQQLGTPNYDVVLEVPELSVDSIGLTVEQLRAHVALDLNAVNLVALNAGVDVSIDRVQLDITGVLAEAYLYVDLNNVTRIVSRVVRALNHNPELLTQLLTTVDTTVSAVGGVARNVLEPGGVASQAVGVVGQPLQNMTQAGGLLSQTVNTLGQTVQRTVDAGGNLVERTLDATGNVVNQRALGNLLNTGDRVLRETTNAAGQTVRQVQDQSGAVIEYTLDQAGNIASVRVLRQATQPRR
jgi:hypothetical protein